MATAFDNNSEFSNDPAEAVMTIRTARKGVVRAALVALAIVVCSVAAAVAVVRYSHIAHWAKILFILVVICHIILAADNISYALDRLWRLPAYQALQCERQRLGFFLSRLAAVCRPGVALESRGANRAYKAWRARTASGAPAGLRVLVLDSNKLIKYQICRFGAEFIICQTYQFDSSADAAAAFERGIVDGHAAAEVFGEDDPHILRQLNTVFEQLTSQEVTQTPPPNGGEFPTHTV